MKNTIVKPGCRLPSVCTPSYLIGNTVNALTRAGLKSRIPEFTNDLSETGAISDYHRILEIAARYVEFD